MVHGAIDLAVHKSVTVAASQERAFEVFTAGMAGWWPLESHRIGEAAAETVVLEPHAGGRWFERAGDGAECDWGRVLEWDPPARVLLAWQIDPDWQYDPDPAKATQIEVRFVAEGPETTRVEVVHRGIEVHGARAQELHAAIDSPQGWTGLLTLYGEAVSDS